MYKQLLYIHISCKCDTNRAGHFTLDAHASRPVACFGHLCARILVSLVPYTYLCEPRLRGSSSWASIKRQGWGEYYSGTRLAQNDKHEYTKNIVLEYYSSTDFPVLILVCSVLAPALLRGSRLYIWDLQKLPLLSISWFWRNCGPSNCRFNFLLYRYASWVFFMSSMCFRVPHLCSKIPKIYNWSMDIGVHSVYFRGDFAIKTVVGFLR